MRYLFFLALAWSAISSANAQTSGVVGIVLESPSNAPLTGVSILLRSAADTTQAAAGASSDENGRFKIENVAAGLYEMELTYLGFERLRVRNLRLEAGAVFPLDTLRMRPTSQDLGIVEVEARAIRVEILGDTVQFNATAFKTRENAMLEDLLKKMPGISVDKGGGLKFNGQPIDNITINGQNLFDGDTKTPNKTLPADFVDKIQLFDTKNPDGSTADGGDGNNSKTLNVVTKTSAVALKSGKIEAGSGSDTDSLEWRYKLSGSFTFLGGDRNIVASIGANNVNEPEFSNDDALGAFFDLLNSQSGFGSSPRATQQQSLMNSYTFSNEGITRTLGGGISYSDKWHKKLKVTASYYYLNNKDWESTEREQRFFSPAGGFAQRYKEQRRVTQNAYNHRFKLNFNWDIDSLNKITLTSRASFGAGAGAQDFAGDNFASDNAIDPISGISSLQRRSTGRLTTSHTLRYDKKFLRPRRSLAVELSGSWADNDSRLLQISDLASSSSADNLNQLQTQASGALSASGEITYTEPIGERNSFDINYSQNYNRQNSEWLTNDFAAAVNQYSDFDTLLSAQFQSETLRSRPRLRYSYKSKNEKLSFNTALSYQYLLLRGEQQLPYTDEIRRDFHNVLPNVNLNYKLSKTFSLRLNYGAYTTAPSVQQLQTAVDNRNPLSLFTGNEQLQQTFIHNLSAGGNFANPTKGQSAFFNVHYIHQRQYIGFATIVANSDTLIGNAISLAKGGQFAQFTNLGSASSIGSYFTYTHPLKKIDGELSFSSSFNLARLPVVLNNQASSTLNISPYATIYIEAPLFDEVVEISAYTSINNQYSRRAFSKEYSQFLQISSMFSLDVLPSKAWKIGTMFSHQYIQGFVDGLGQNIFYFRADISYSFMKNRRATLQLSANDLLNQNNNLQRSVTDIYIEDQRTRTLQRYIMLHFTYNFRPDDKGGDDMIFFDPS